MSYSTRNVSIFVAILLILTVLSQIVYTMTLSGVGIVEGWPLRSTIWTVEILLFSAIAVASLMLLAGSSSMHLGWAALAVAGLVNILQSGIGLSMFLPATEAGPEFGPLMGTVLKGSFLFYYLAKVILGVAAIAFGLALFRGTAGLGKALGLASLLAGAVAVVLNIAAVRMGLGAVPLAGMSGAIATFLAGCAVWYASGTAEE